MRCITLAKAFRTHNLNPTFICKKLSGNIINVIRDNQFPVVEIECIDSLDSINDRHTIKLNNQHELIDAENTIRLIQDMSLDLLVVDHYALSSIWEKKINDFVQNIMVIDDLANRPHKCAFLLDQNYHPQPKEKYKGLVNNTCMQLIGPQYAILDESYREFAKLNRLRGMKVKNILVFFGSYDVSGETIKVLDAFLKINTDEIELNIVVGVNNPNKDYIQQKCLEKNYNFHCQINNMAELIYNADLGIGASGASTWERCILGLPTLTTIVADNQIEVANGLSKIRAINLIGVHQNLSKKDYRARINEAINNHSQRALLSLNAKNIVSFGTDIIAKLILAKLK